MDSAETQAYINNFRRRLAPYLRPDVGLACSVYPALSGGAILVFRVGPGVENDDVYQEERPTLGQALEQIEQHAFGGNLEGFTFSGTNLILENDRIILIKDGSSSEWSDAAAEKDTQRVLSPDIRGAE